MAYGVGLRATSFAASAGLLALAAIAALTMTFTTARIEELPQGDPIEIFREPPPPPPVDTHVRMQPQTQSQVIDDADPPPLQTQDEQPAQQTQVAFATGPVGPMTISDPRWSRRPRDLDRFYPRRARELGVEGVAVLDCLVAINGVLTCNVISETPQNWGFGEAALRISRQHQMVPAMRDGVAVEGRYRMRVPFELH